MPLQTRIVFEQERILLGPGGLTPAYADLLSRLEGNLPKNCLQWGKNWFKFNGYCGVVQVGNILFEVLPKIDKVDDGLSCRNILLHMLAHSRKVPLLHAGDGELRNQRNFLLDFFIERYLDRLQSNLRYGMQRGYVEKEDNIRTIKGRIQIATQIRKNLGDKSKIACKFEELSKDILLNRVIFQALLLLQKLAMKEQLKKAIQEIRSLFDGVSEEPISISQAERLQFSRLNVSWQIIYMQSLDFLRGWYPDFYGGNKQAFAFLFPMGQLFEEFIYRCTLGILPSNDYMISAQKPRLNIMSRGKNKYFQMKPDIFIERRSDKHRWIWDTKWKMFDGDDRKLGISQADIYQMYAYGEEYSTKGICLIYPWHQEMESNASVTLFHFSQKQRPLYCVQVDLSVMANGHQAFLNHLKSTLLITL